jgi:hypothetical protein
LMEHSIKLPSNVHVWYGTFVVHSTNIPYM